MVKLKSVVSLFRLKKKKNKKKSKSAVYTLNEPINKRSIHIRTSTEQKAEAEKINPIKQKTSDNQSMDDKTSRNESVIANTVPLIGMLPLFSVFYILFVIFYILSFLIQIMQVTKKLSLKYLNRMILLKKSKNQHQILKH